jgi:hypothetical protein
MITILIGPQASGKSLLAEQAIQTAKDNGIPCPWVIEGIPATPSTDFMNTLQAREINGLNTIFTLQVNNGHVHIPLWLTKRFNPRFIKLNPSPSKTVNV